MKCSKQSKSFAVDYRSAKGLNFIKQAKDSESTNDKHFLAEI